MQLKIDRKLLPHKPRYLDGPNGSLSYMGQILRQMGYPTTTPGKREPCILVTDTQTPCPPFTRYCLSKLVQSDLATDIINLTPATEYLLPKLLAPYNHTIIFT